MRLRTQPVSNPVVARYVQDADRLICCGFFYPSGNMDVRPRGGPESPGLVTMCCYVHVHAVTRSQTQPCYAGPFQHSLLNGRLRLLQTIAVLPRPWPPVRTQEFCGCLKQGKHLRPAAPPESEHRVAALHHLGGMHPPGKVLLHFLCKI